MNYLSNQHISIPVKTFNAVFLCNWCRWCPSHCTCRYIIHFLYKRSSFFHSIHSYPGETLHTRLQYTGQLLTTDRDHMRKSFSKSLQEYFEKSSIDGPIYFRFIWAFIVCKARLIQLRQERFSMKPIHFLYSLLSSKKQDKTTLYILQIRTKKYILKINIVISHMTILRKGTS